VLQEHDRAGQGAPQDTWTRAAKREKDIALAAAAPKEEVATADEKIKKVTASKVRRKKASTPKKKD
jgi:hypothetical protein